MILSLLVAAALSTPSQPNVILISMFATLITKDSINLLLIDSNNFT